MILIGIVWAQRHIASIKFGATTTIKRFILQAIAPNLQILVLVLVIFTAVIRVGKKNVILH